MLVSVNVVSKFKGNFLQQDLLLDNNNLLVAFIVNFKSILPSFVTFSFKIWDFCYDLICDFRKSFIFKSTLMEFSMLIYYSDCFIAFY